MAPILGSSEGSSALMRELLPTPLSPENRFTQPSQAFRMASMPSPVLEEITKVSYPIFRYTEAMVSLCSSVARSALDSTSSTGMFAASASTSNLSAIRKLKSGCTSAKVITSMSRFATVGLSR